jgi:hypothetical protein
MSGNPAFQSSAFQNNAFQSGVSLVAATYSLGSPAFAAPALHAKHALNTVSYTLGSPVFATPALTWRSPVTSYTLGSPVFATPPLQIHFNLSVAAYSLGSPVFATPALTGIGITFHANPYSLASPVIALPSMGRRLTLNGRALTLGSPSFATPLLTVNYQLRSNEWASSSPDFARPHLTNNYVLSVVFPFWLGSPTSAPAPIVLTTSLLHANDYWLDSPTAGFPRFQWSIDPSKPVLPPTYFTQAEEAANILKQLMNYVLMSVPSGITPVTNNVRRLASTLRDHAEEAIRGITLGTQLQQVYSAADLAGASYGGIEMARQYLMKQAASQSIFTQILFRSALVMTLALECKIVSRMTFANQEQCQNMVLHIRAIFEDAKAIGIDDVDALVYQSLTTLGGAIMNHLARTQLKLPRYLSWESRSPMPSLYLAQRIYADASRADEIEKENRIIHPAFCPTKIRVLSDAPVGR